MSSSDIIVLAGGWSVSQYNLRNLEQRGYLIAVNDSAIYTKPHAAVTMDRKWIEARYWLLRTLGIPQVWVRRGVCKNVKLEGRQFLEFGSAGHKKDPNGPAQLSELHGVLNGSNSGMTAINLAYQLAKTGGSRVFLLGFDMCRGPKGEHHWYPPYPWAPDGATGKVSFDDWTKEFYGIQAAFASRDIPLYNVTHHSNLPTCIPRQTYREFMENA